MKYSVAVCKDGKYVLVSRKTLCHDVSLYVTL